MLNAKIQTQDDIKIVYLDGRMDMSNASKCEEILSNDMSGTTKIIFDLSGLTFIDSTGVGSLISAIKTAHKMNIRFELVNVPEGIEQILTVIGVYDVLNILYENH